MPRRARERLNEYADVWSTRSIRAWEEGWWEMPIAVGNLIAKIIGAGDGEVTMHPNVSVAQSIVASCFNWGAKRNKVVSEGLNFPSNLYLHRQLESLGARVVTVPSEDGITIPLEALLHAIDDQTLLVSVSHVIFKSAYIQDLAAITRRAHQVGALVIADIYQSAGAVPINVRELNLDFATRRIGEMVVRRTGRGLPLRAPRSVACAEAAPDRLGGASRSVCLRSRSYRLCTGRLSFSQRHAEYSRTLCGAIRL